MASVKKTRANNVATKKKAVKEYVVIKEGRNKGKYINKEGRIYTKSELRQRRPELF